MDCNKSISKKISIIGCGNIGSVIANQFLYQNFQCNLDIFLYDLDFEALNGKYYDLNHALNIDTNFNKKKITYNFTEHLENTLQDSDVIIITAGKKRTTGMTRDDLLKDNKQIIINIAEKVKKYAKNAFVILITNPLDIICYYFLQESQLPREKVIGMSGILDSARFRSFIYQKLQDKIIDCKEIEGIIIGSHNDSMFYAKNSIKINDMSFYEIIDRNILSIADFDEILDQTRKIGSKINSLIGTSAYFAPASGAVNMAMSFLNNENKLISSSFFLQNHEYHQTESVFIGIPVVINKNGANLYNIKLENDEIEKLSLNVKELRKYY